MIDIEKYEEELAVMKLHDSVYSKEAKNALANAGNCIGLGMPWQAEAYIAIAKFCRTQLGASKDRLERMNEELRQEREAE